MQGGLKVCWGEDEARAAQAGEAALAQRRTPGRARTNPPDPAHFEQASALVTEDALAEDTPCGPDVERHVAAIGAYAEAGFDELYINQIGPEQKTFFAAYRDEVLPRVRG